MMAMGQSATALGCTRGLIGVPEASGLTDRQLLERFAAQGDEAAFAALVRRHGPLVWGVCWRVLHHTQDAEDALQATFWVLARKASSMHWQESVSNWLYEVAYRVASEAKSKSTQRRLHERKAADVPKAAAIPETAWRELCTVLDEELQSLPQKYRTPLLLCYLEGQTRDQAARHLGWSRRTLQRRLEQGLALLRNRLARRGATLSAALLAAGLTGQTSSAATAHLAAALAKAASAAAGAPAASAGAFSIQATAFAGQALKGMALSKWMIGASFTLALSLLTAGAFTFAHQTPMTEGPVAQQEDGPPLGPRIEKDQSCRDEQVGPEWRGDTLPTEAIGLANRKTVAVNVFPDSKPAGLSPESAQAREPHPLTVDRAPTNPVALGPRTKSGSPRGKRVLLPDRSRASARDPITGQKRARYEENQDPVLGVAFLRRQLEHRPVANRQTR